MVSRLVFLLGLLVVAASASRYPYSNVQEMKQKVNVAYNELVNVKQNFKPISKADAVCDANVKAALDVFVNCSDVFNPVMDYLNPASNDSNLPNLPTFCNSTCAVNIRAHLDLLSNCGESIDGLSSTLKSSFQIIVSFINLPCFRFGGKFCIQPYRAFLKAAVYTGANIDTTTEVQFKATFTPLCADTCIPEFMKQFTVFGDKASRSSLLGLQTFCIKDGDKLCMAEGVAVGMLEKNVTSLSPNPSNPLSKPKAGYVQAVKDMTERACSTRCSAKIATITQTLGYATADNDLDRQKKLNKSIEEGAETDFLCMRKSATEYCTVSAASFVENTDLSSIAACALNTASCGCQADAQLIMSTMGCCLVPTVSTKFPTMMSTFLELFKRCGVTIPSVCSGSKSVTGNLKLKNLKYTYVSSKMDKVKADIANDIASNIGVSPSKISVVLSQDGTGTNVAYTIMTSNDSEGPAITSEMSAQISAGTFNLPTINSYESTSKVSADAGISTDVSSTTTTTDVSSTGSSSSSSPASNVLPSFVLLFALIAAKALF